MGSSSKLMASRVAASAASAGASTGAYGMGKPEAITAWFGSLVFAQFAHSKLPPEQALYAWSVCGTIAGAVLAGLHMKQAGWLQRVTRAALCFVSGLIFAPWAIATLPRSQMTPDWWHAFGASGIGAAVAWIIVDEAGPAVREYIKDWRKKRRTRS